jgi:hypothetical protein
MAEDGRNGTNLRGLGGRFWATTTVNRIAVLAAVLWAVLVFSYAVGYFAAGGGGQARGTVFLDTVFFLVALVLPLGLIMLAAWLAAELVRMRTTVADLIAVSAPLAEALADTRIALAEEGPLKPRDLDRSVRYAIADAEASMRRELRQSLDDALAQIRDGQRRLEAEMALVGRSAPPLASAVLGRTARPEPEPRQAWHGAEAVEAAALPTADLLRALDFPRDPDDREGFRALKRAQRDPALAAVLRAAEDVLNCLSQRGVFMDDLRPEPASPDAWRAFMTGSGGADPLDDVAGVRDAAALDTVRDLAETDAAFRETMDFFQLRFRAVIAAYASDADDDTLVELADTRSGRVFQLGARALPPPEADGG